MVGLTAQPDLSADAVAITAGANQLQDEPAVDIGADILPKLCRLAERAYDDVDFSVVIKIRKGAAAVGARDGKAGFLGNVRKRAVPKISKETVGLLVVRGLKQVDQVIDVRIGGKKILRAVVVKIKEAVAPATARCGQGSQPALMRCVLK